MSLSEPVEVNLRDGTGVLLGGGMGVVPREGTGNACKGGFPFGVVVPGPPMDVSNGLGVLAPCPVPG